MFHEQAIFLGESRLTVEYGVDDQLGVSLLVPLRLVVDEIAYTDVSSGQEVEVAEEIHHRDETLTGLADPWLTGRFAFGWGDTTLDFRLGMTLPLGRTEPDPNRLGELGQAHQHFQFGTGTFNPLLGFEVSHRVGRWRLALWGLTQQVLYENEHGYKAGDRYTAGLVASRWLGRRWRAQGGLEVQHETTERWHGEMPEMDGNLGRVDVLAGLGGAVRVGEAVELTASVRVPVYVNVVEAQLEYPVLAVLGATVAWDVGPRQPRRMEHAHEHAHEHMHEQAHVHEHALARDVDWTGVDVASLAEAGEAVELAGVPGKITVIDFWAPWCDPCKVLDARLADLGRAHPDRLAVRKINIVDWDSPAAKRYLAPAGHDLPHVKVLAADGALVLEQSGDPEAIAAAVEKALGP